MRKRGELSNEHSAKVYQGARACELLLLPVAGKEEGKSLLRTRSQMLPHSSHLRRVLTMEKSNDQVTHGCLDAGAWLSTDEPSSGPVQQCMPLILSKDSVW